MKTVPKSLERFPEMTITSIFGIRYETPANVIPAALQTLQVASSSRAAPPQPTHRIVHRPASPQRHTVVSHL